MSLTLHVTCTVCNNHKHMRVCGSMQAIVRLCGGCCCWPLPYRVRLLASSAAAPLATCSRLSEADSGCRHMPMRHGQASMRMSLCTQAVKISYTPPPFFSGRHVMLKNRKAQAVSCMLLLQQLQGSGRRGILRLQGIAPENVYFILHTFLFFCESGSLGTAVHVPCCVLICRTESPRHEASSRRQKKHLHAFSAAGACAMAAGCSGSSAFCLETVQHMVYYLPSGYQHFKDKVCLDVGHLPRL